MNALGQPTEYKHGSNIICEKIFDELGLPDRFKAGTTVDPIAIQNLDFGWNYQTGNMNQRSDAYNTESFANISYDNLNRLLKSEVTGQPPIEINYYPNGNIQNKTNIGGYSYNGDKLNAVERVGNSAGDISSMTQDIEYTPFNKVSKITEGNYLLQIGYGPDQQRRQSVLTDATGMIRNTIYSGNYEKQTADDGNIYEVNYLPGGAINVRKNGDAASDQLFYVFTDHLGSFNTITNAAGEKVLEQNFDAWGRKRDPAEWDYDFGNYTPPTLPAGTHDPKKWLLRGFTGHEHLDEFELINMNGRVYDPLLGRMLSPDNFVQAPDFTQSYNRYSYANNNPLVYSDPSGNKWVSSADYDINMGGYWEPDNFINPITDWVDYVFSSIVDFFGGKVGETGEVKFPDQYDENGEAKTYYRSEPGYSEYTSEEDIGGFYSGMPNNDAGAGNNIEKAPGEVGTDAIFYGQRPDGTYFRGGPLFGWHDDQVHTVTDPRFTRIQEATFLRVANSIEYFLGGGYGPAPSEIQPGYIYIAWPKYSGGNTVEGWYFGVARIRDAVNVRPVIPFAFGTFRPIYETDPLNPRWDELVPRR